MSKITINSFAKKAYNAYLKAGMTPEGACGLMGNQYSESAGFIANRMEFLLKSLLKVYNDVTYTAAIDSGKISRAEFLNPFPGKQYGYGLVQWTSPGRKAGLYDLAKKRKVSIADEQLQIDYVLIEMGKSYKNVLNVLMSTNSVKQASDYVLKYYESPADQSDRIKNIRYEYAMEYYNYFVNNTKKDNSVKTADDYVNACKSWLGYRESNGTHKTIIDIYNSVKPLPRGYAVQYYDEWCDTFISAAGIKADMIEKINRECGVEEHVKLFKNMGIWIEDGKITPKIGDIIVYSWRKKAQPNDSYSDHIGVVESVTGNTITVIEGNKDEEVGRRVIPVGWGYIRGYARPKYDIDKTVVVEVPESNPQESVKPVVIGANDGVMSYAPQWVGECTADTLNVRVWAGTTYPNIKSWPLLGYGNLVDVCDAVKGEDGADWYFVRIDGQIFGFVHSDYIQKKS